jgi:hypothetical protein
VVPLLAEQKTPGKPDSVHRREAVALLQDPRRHSRDKLRDLEAIVKDDILEKNVYRDADGQFVLCEHTMAILAGDLEKDRAFFYDVWTVSSEGWRVCKYCGERLLGDDLVDQTDFDEQGFVMNKKESLPVGQTFHGDAVAAYAVGLKAITGIFQMENPSDSVAFYVLSLLQVLPEAETTAFFLSQGRAQVAKLGKLTDTKLELAGAIGLAITVLLLQAHVPLLEAHRAFWSKSLSFAGYPRDAPAPERFSLIDILLMVLENTYRGYPAELPGPIKPFIRAVLSKPRTVRTNVVELLNKRFLLTKEIQDSLAEARALVKRSPEEPATTTLPLQQEELTIKGYPSCLSGHALFGGTLPPRIRQPEVALRRGIQAAASREAVTIPVSVRVKVAEVPRDQIRRRLALKGTIGKDSTQTNLLLANHLANLTRKPLPIATVDPTQSPALLRDIAKGLVNEASQGLKVDPSKDVTLFCLLADYDKAKAEARKVRATERITYVQRMADFSDLEREVNMELAKRGMAPTIIALTERTELGGTVDLSHLMDIGVGLPQDTEEQGDVLRSNAGAGVDNGNYGDYHAMPSNDGRDPQETSLLDDQERSI